MAELVECIQGLARVNGPFPNFVDSKLKTRVK